MGWLRGMAVNEIVRCVTRPGVGLRWVFPAVLCRAMAFAARFPVFFDTPVDVLSCNGFGGVFGVPGCVIAGVRVN